MSLKKLVGLLAGFALAVGLIGSGVSAAFTDQVTAVQHISVGTFSCTIVSPSDGLIAADGKSVLFAPPTIESPAPGTAPFSFTVANTGSMPAVLTVVESAVSAPFSNILVSPAAVILPVSGTHTYAAGVSWTELTNANLGTSGDVQYTVNCGEVQAPTVTFSSVLDPNSLGGDDLYVPRVDNTINGSGWAPGVPVSVTLTMQYGASGTFDLSTWYPIGTDASGNILISGTIGTSGFLGANTWQDDCSNGAVVQHGTQLVTVTATQGALTATGTGSAPCPN